MRITVAAALVALLFVGGVASAQDNPVVGTFSFAGSEDGRPTKGDVVIRAAGPQLILEAKLAGGGHRMGRGLYQGAAPRAATTATAVVGTASWTIAVEVSATTVGLANALTGDTAPVRSTNKTIELRPVAGGVEAVLRDGVRVLGVERLTRKHMVLICHHDTYTDSHRNAFRTFAKQVAAYYKQKGYERADLVLGSDWQGFIAYLNAAEADGRVYDRLVFIGHGGWDGPYFWGQNGGTSQVSPNCGGALWEDALVALRRALSLDARIFVSACHGGGSDRYERASESAPRLAWVDSIAARTGRTAVGPAGKTSTEWSLRAVRAGIEGDGGVVQETRIATKAGARSVLTGQSVKLD